MLPGAIQVHLFAHLVRSLAVRVHELPRALTSVY